VDGLLWFHSSIEEVLAVAALPGWRNPAVIGPDTTTDASQTVWLVPPVMGLTIRSSSYHFSHLLPLAMATPRLVRDIRPGARSSSPYGLTALGNTLFFVANDGTSGSELWRSDGTSAGTVRVADIRPGSASSYPQGLTAIENTLYFNANDGSSGKELWKSDGTAAGTYLLLNDGTVGGSLSADLVVDITGYSGTPPSAWCKAGGVGVWLTRLTVPLVLQIRESAAMRSVAKGSDTKR